MYSWVKFVFIFLFFIYYFFLSPWFWFACFILSHKQRNPWHSTCCVQAIENECNNVVVMMKLKSFFWRTTLSWVAQVWSLFMIPAHSLDHPISHSQLGLHVCINCWLSASGGRGLPGGCLFAETLLQQFSSREDVLCHEVMCNQRSKVLTMTTAYSGRWCVVGGVKPF